jgi:hypothetical protein
LQVGDGTATYYHYINIGGSSVDLYLGQPATTTNLFGIGAGNHGLILQDKPGKSLVFGTGSNSVDLHFVTNGSVRATIKKSTGCFLINTLTDNGVDVLQVNGSVLATGYKIPSGTSNQILLANGSVTTLQNSMAVDGTGRVVPTVDAVNQQSNNIARAVVATGFLDTTDTFRLSRVDDNTLGISASAYGIAFSQVFKTPPFAPSSAVVNITTRNIPLSAIGLTGTGTAIKFVGYRMSDDSILFSDTQFIQSPSVSQLGIVLVKYDAGVTSFIDADRTTITIPDVAAYSNLDTSSTGIKVFTSIAAIPGTLSHSNTAGKLIGISVAWGTSNNDIQLIAASALTSFTRLHPGNKLTVVPPAVVTTMDPTQYYDGAALIPIPGNPNQATVQRLLFTVRGNFVWQYGEQLYANLIAAQNNILQAKFTDILPEGTFAEVGRMAITASCTDISSSLAQYYPTGAGGGGGSSTAGPTTWGTIVGSIDDQLDLKARLDSKASIDLKPRKNITGVTYTIVAGDENFILYTTNTSPVVITIPSGLASNKEYEVFQYGEGQVSYVVSGTTLLYTSYEQPKHEEVNTRVFITWVDTEKYQLTGQLSAY